MSATLFQVVPSALEATTGRARSRWRIDDATWVAALAESSGCDAQRVGLKIWALVLARVAGERQARVGRDDASWIVEVPDDGEIAAWLREPPQPCSEPADSSWGPSSNVALSWWIDGDELVGERALDQLDEATVERLAATWMSFASRLAGATSLGDVDVVDDEERAGLLAGNDETRTRYRPRATVHELFREQARARPDRPALVWMGGSLSYGELDARSDALAHRLVAEGVGPDIPVAVTLPRGPDALVAVLAILKAGGAYLPLDSGYPRERLLFIIEDAGARVLIGDRDHPELASLCDRTVYVTDHHPAAGPVAEQATARSLAYVMYTSGSTGTPKGVLIEHRSIVRLVGRVRYVTLDSETTFLHAAPLGFDASTLEIWGPLLHGGRCAIYPDPVPTGEGLARIITALGVTHAWLTAALFNAVVDDDPSHLRGLRQLFTGGEALSPRHVREALAALPDTEIHNGYGPTECTTFTTTHAIARDTPPTATSIPIGRPIADTAVYVLNRRRRLVPKGFIGELYIGGLGVARGYLARPELDRERFVDNLIDPRDDDDRLYRTGDLVRWRDDGTLDFIGRADKQVKIRGFRIELGEIEAALSRIDGVRAGAVVARDDGTGKRLVAYVVPTGALDVSRVRAALSEVLPDFMVPTHYVMLDALPRTANGKLNRAGLPAPSAERPQLAQPYRAPRGELESLLCSIFADVLGLDRVGSQDGFFELGGNSLQSLQVLKRLRDAGKGALSPARFFASPTPSGLARALTEGDGDDALLVRRRRREPDEPIAIVGMAGRFPGAPDIGTFWKNLCAGMESIRFFDAEEIDASIPRDLVAQPAYVAARGVLDDVAGFDHRFFGVSPLEARLTDPQHRLFLEICWEALEHAGYVPEAAPGPVGVFGGMYNATYLQRHLWPQPDVIARLGELQVMLGNEKDYVTTRAAHRLGLRGPAVSVHTACSTSLVAAAMAMDSLRRGDCDLALAGGVAITCPPHSGYLHEEGSIASPDGHTRTFDARAAGTVFSDGAAMVALRRLSDALADGDTVYAVLRGAAMNNDGAERASFTAPSPDGQATVIAAALDAAGVDARTISYVEAHGTATPLGDPIEIEGLTRAFRRDTDDEGFCAIGSLKSNVGHMVIAAGAAGLVKTALGLHHRLIPPSINFSSPSPKIDFSRSPFRVQTELGPWKSDGTPRRAGVSAFGFGGTNCHVILEESPPSPAPEPSTRSAQLLVVSGRTDGALAEATARLASHLAEAPPVDLADVAFTLQRGRRAFDHRRWLVASTVREAAERLEHPAPKFSGKREVGEHVPELAFAFPGQGSQYRAMGRDLYATEPAFRHAYDECCEVLAPLMGGDPKETFWSDDPEALVATRVTQPAVMSVEVALGRMLIGWGLHPTALIGHSVGEFACAVLAGVMDLSDALSLVHERGRLMQALPAGSMLSIRAPVTRVQSLLPDGVVIACENAPSLCVASGPTESVEALRKRLEADEVPARMLKTSHAFHSPMMDSIVDAMEDEVAAIRLAAPTIPIASTVTASWMSDEQATSPRYWAEHLRRPVRFAPAVATLMGSERRLLVELGPRATLCALARQSVKGNRSLPLAVPTMGSEPDEESAALAAGLGQLWSAGVNVDWRAYHEHARRRRVPLPTYPFQRERHWIDAPAATAVSVAAPAAVAPPPPVPPSQPLATPVMTAPAPSRIERLISEICTIVEDVSGVELDASHADVPWLDLGLDSLALTQLALGLKRVMEVDVTFRQIMEDLPTVRLLAARLDESLPPEEPTIASAAPGEVASVAPTAPLAAPPMQATPSGSATPDYVRQLIDQQLAVMQQQLALLGGAQAAGAGEAQAAMGSAAPAAEAKTKPRAKKEHAAKPATYNVKKAFGAIARIHTDADELTPQQRTRLNAFVERYTRRTAKSKAYTAEHRPHMADPRVVNGFRPLTKELTYQIVIERSRGSRLWDIDGNEYIDVLNGFGMNMFGWQPDFIRRAVHEQVDAGYEIGPQHVLAGEVARLFCEVAGQERAAFCNTGSEAVMGCTRIARTVTGRSTIAIFTGAYHGIFDEVIVRGTKKLRSIPAAPGIMPSSTQNVLVLDYGTPESLEILRERADELAAIMVEPVQSRRPDFAPVAFLRELRALTEQSGALLIFDEVVTGFRSHPRGAQGLFGIQADLASYGKVVGGGMPIGVIAGKRPFMDALDGGGWQFGDDSKPTVGVTYFAGTFVRHPLALAAAKAVLEHLRDEGPALQERLTSTTAAMVARINEAMGELGAPMKLNTFASLWRNTFTDDLPYADLVYAMLRDRGIHILDNFPCFLTTSHGQEEVDAIVSAYREAATEMQQAGFFPRRAPSVCVPEGPVRSVPTTEPQREVWLGARLGDSSSLAYNESVCLHFRGELDVAAMRKAVRQLPERFDAFRATFSDDGQRMLVHEHAPALEVPLVEDARQLDAIVERHVTEPFDLSEGPLVRADLVRLAPDHHALVFTGHHIVLDGWSYWVLVKDLAALYEHARGGPAPAPAPSFADYAVTQHERQGSPEMQDNERYWVSRFADGAPTLDLPTDRPRPAVRTQTASRVDHVLDAGLIAAVKRTGAKAGASLFATMLGAFDALLYRLTGQTDLVVGVPAAGQAVAGLEGLVGHAVNMLPLRVTLEDEIPFAQLCTAARRTMLDAYDHQEVTFGRVLQMLPIRRDPSRLPLISVMFNIDQALSAEAKRFSEMELSFVSNARRFETFELFVNAVDEGAEGMRLECQYNTDLFDETSVSRWLASFEQLLRDAVDDPQRPIGELSILCAEDRRALARFNATSADYPREASVVSLIQHAAQAHPDAIAVRAGETAVTYRELMGRAGGVAQALVDRGVRPGERVGVMVSRDRHLVPSLLGVLAAGAAYVPLDPAFPPERLAFMTDDADLKVIVTTADLADRATRATLAVEDLDHADMPVTAGGEIAYVIYTSGSTGRPKGVQIPHRAVVNFLTSMASEPGLGRDDRLVAVTTPSFDISVLELFLPLTVGAEVVLASPEEVVDGVALAELIASSRATVMQATPATWRLLVEADWRRPGFKALCGGEAFPADLAEDLRERAGELWNMYGPTETTVWSAIHAVERVENPLPIGRPIQNTGIEILDDHGRPVPIGVVGEIVIGGDGVAAGYLDRPRLTAERFVRDADGRVRYRTGDLGRWRNDGRLVCLGRNDDQVKVRGYRIELGEIEARLGRHPAVDRAAVVAREDRPGDVRLVAYVVPRGEISTPALREHLQAGLPDSMVPSHYVMLRDLPLTANRKIDRRALPAPDAASAATTVSTEDDAPRNQLEERVASAFREVLAVPRVGMQDDFFDLGGHSLLVARMTASLSRELDVTVPMAVAFQETTVRRLAAWIEAQRGGPAPVIERRVGDGPAPLSLMQQRVWYLEQLQIGRTVFHVPSAHRLTGHLDEAAFSRAFADLLERQPALRTVIDVAGDEPVQRVLEDVDVALFPAEDLSARPAEERARILADRLDHEIRRPFDLTTGPLFRARMFRLGPEEHVFFFMPHHIIFDGWSFDLLYEEMADLYAARREQRDPERPLPPVTYGDFAVWHRGWLQGEELERQVAYWRDELEGAPDAMEVAGDRPRPARQTGEGDTVWLTIDAETTERLRAVAQRERATTFMVLLAAWATLLQRLSGEREVVVGTPVRGRMLPEVEKVMGFFVNALPLRIGIDMDASFLANLNALRAKLVEAFGHQDVPFEHLVRVLDVPRDESRFPIYQAFFSYQDARGRPGRWGDLAHENVPVFQPAAAQDLALWFLEGPTGAVGGLNYNLDIYEAETAERIKESYLELIDAIVAEPERPVRELAAIGNRERAALEAYNATTTATPEASCLATFLAPAFADHRDRIAARCGDRGVTYGALWARAGAIASALRGRGVAPGDVVGVHVERSIDMLAALLGTTRAGASYLPLDPSFPPERLAFMLADANASVVISDEALPETLGETRGSALRLSEVPEAADGPVHEAEGEDVAYLIYTSGSTGKPKGVRIPHRALLNFLASMAETPGLSREDRLVAVTTLSFDIAELELLLPLSVGAEVVIASKEDVTDGHRLRALLDEATVMQATPATWRLLLEAGWRGRQGFKILCGGEALPEDLAEKLLGCGELWNMYGPTETTIWSSCAKIEPGSGAVTVGRPIANTKIWVVDERDALVPLGATGEILIGGAGVALGYHNRPELDAERFLDDPFGHGGRLYRTGDLGRMRHDMTLQHLGRRDFQVKVRGFRIELGEIEKALADHVGPAVVVTRPGPGGEPRLVAYVVGEALPPAAELRDRLRATLPEYMLPSVFVPIAAIPTTPNGKVDRKALPAPPEARPAARDAVDGAPRTTSEKMVAAVWKDLLEIDRVSRSDNFLDLGGHSLLIMRAVTILEKETGKRVSPRAFVFQNLGQIALEYEQPEPEPEVPSAPEPVAQRLVSRLISAFRRRP